MSKIAPVLGTIGAVGMGFMVYKSQQPSLVRAQSSTPDPKKKNLVRRHSSGEHAFLPSRQDRKAINDANKSFGVPQNLVQDAAGDRLPTTRGY